MSDTHPLTQRQIRCLERLPEGYEIVSIDDRPLIVRRPKGQLLRVKQNGRLERVVERAWSYLHVNG